MTSISRSMELPGKRALRFSGRFFRGRSLLGGPIFFCDMVRTGRRGRYVIVRTIYGVLLLSVVALVFQPWLYAMGRVTLTFNDLAHVADKCFTMVTLVQFVAVICLTPAYAASAITEERERRTLEYLLATDLSSREIIVGKFLSRLANLTLLFFTGLPVVALLQLFGGIDLKVVLTTYAAIVLFMMTLAALSILAAVHARRTRAAIMETYVILAVYLVVPPIIYDAAKTVWPPNYGLHFLIAGNPLLLGLATAAGSQSFIARLLGSLTQFAEFHIVVTIGLLWWAVRRLRPSAQRTHRRRSTTSAALPRKTRRVWGPPMVWKEMAVRGLPRGRVASRLLVALTMFLVLLPMALVLFESQSRYRIEDLNLCVRFYGTILSTVLFIAIILRASNTIIVERRKQTLETLLATPLSTAQILWGKWFGTILSMRHGLACLAIVWVLGVATNALHPLPLFALVVAMTIYSAAGASIGLFASVFARSPMLSHMTAIVLAVCLAVGQAFFLAAHAPEFSILPGKEIPFIYLLPPAVMALLTLPTRAWTNPSPAEYYFTPGSGWNQGAALPLLGQSLLTWFIFAVVFYQLAKWSFGRRRNNRYLFASFRIRKKLTES